MIIFTGKSFYKVVHTMCYGWISGVLGDSCVEQYKNKKTFFKMKLLATKYNITICWFYGVPGHGRGLVEAMSSFGVKQPLKHEIITEDKWFPSANMIVLFLVQHLEDLGDYSKEYHLIDEEETSKIRARKQGEHTLKPGVTT